jgi:uncharacterized membrane protein YphA (DoxX/SURF4 family)
METRSIAGRHWRNPRNGETTMPATTSTRRQRNASVILWTLQVLLAALFLFAGIFKLVAAPELLKGPVDFPLAFLRFIGACETAGGLGLILPGLLRIRTALTPLAAAGLVIIMIGATVTTAATGPIAPALFPLVIGALAAIVGYGRRGLPLREVSHRRPALQAA